MALGIAAVLIAARCTAEQGPIDSAITALPGTCTTVLIVNDPLPRIEALLSSASLQKVLAKAGLRAFPARGPADLESVRARVIAQKNYIPTAVAVGVPATSWVDIANSFRSALLGALCHSATQTGEADELAGFQRDFGTAIKRLSVPTFFATAVFRDEQTAAALLDRGHELAKGFETLGASVESAVGVVEVKASIGNWMPPQSIAHVLESLGFKQDLAGRETASLAESLAKITGELRLEQHGAVLRLSVAGRPLQASGGVSTRSLGELWKPSDSLLGYAKWDMSAFHRAWLNLAREWSEWESTASGQRLVAQDSEDAFEMFRVTEKHLAIWAHSGCAVATYDQTLDATIHFEGLPRATPLSESEINRFFPPDALTMIADSTRSLGDVFMGRLEKIEGRLALRSMNPDEEGESFRIASSKYYEHMDALRKLVFEESQTMFDPGFAFIASNQGRLEEAGISVTQSFGNWNSKSISNRNVSEFAIIGRIKSRDKRAAYFYRDLYRALLVALGDPGDKKVVEQRDLGLGAPTYVFRPVFWDLLKINGELYVKGDLLPHYFVVGDWLVFSTSPRLSKAMLAARASEPPLVRYPKLTEPIVTMATFSSESYAQMIYDFETIMMVVMTPQSAGDDGSTTAQHQRYMTRVRGVRNALQVMSDIVRLVRDVRWIATENDQRRELRIQVRLDGNSRSTNRS